MAEVYPPVSAGWGDLGTIHKIVRGDYAMVTVWGELSTCF
jgi:hypothetical protein